MRHTAHSQRGLSIVELMVSVAISLAVLSALSYVYLGSRGAYRSNEALARVQEAGRFALDWIARDLRQAGYMGCLSRGIEPVDHSRPNQGGVSAGQAIRAWDRGTGGWANPTLISRVAGDSDVLQVMGILEGRQSAVWNSIDGEIRVVDNCPGFTLGDVVMAVDCERAAVFTVTVMPRGGTAASPYCPNPPDPPGENVVLVHDPSANGANGIVPTNVISPLFQRATRPVVGKFWKVGYFIGQNPRTLRPGLYRYTGSSLTEEVVNNVEDLDVMFGLDTDGDSSVDAYRKASDITASEWPSVVSVRVSVLIVSDETAATLERQVYLLRDTSGDTMPDAQTATDRRLRQVFTTTVALRNRLP